MRTRRLLAWIIGVTVLAAVDYQSRLGARGSAGRLVLSHDLTSLREQHPDAHLAGADDDRRDAGVAGAPHEQVDEVVAANQGLLEVVPAPGLATVLLSEPSICMTFLPSNRWAVAAATTSRISRG